MAPESILTTKNRTILMFSIFYIVAGLVQIGAFAIEGISAPLHLLLLGLLSLVTGYLVFSMKKWAVPLVAGLLAVGLTFGVTTLSGSLALNTIGGDILMNLALIVYIILLSGVSVILLMRRENFN